MPTFCPNKTIGVPTTHIVRPKDADRGMSRTAPFRTEDRGQVLLAEQRLDPGKSDARRTKCPHLVVGRMDRLHQELRESLPLVLVESSAQWIVPNLSLIRFDDGIERMSLRPIERAPCDFARKTVEGRRLKQEEPAVRGLSHDSHMTDAPARNPISGDIDEVTDETFTAETNDVAWLNR